jgi:Truncated hemoglobins
MKYNGTMQTIYQAAGGRDGLLRLASAWHTRVLEDEVVSHAFSHGYHPQHTERLAAYWAEALGGPTTTPTSTVMRPLSSGFTAATGRTRRWTSGRSLVSIRRYSMSASRATSG